MKFGFVMPSCDYNIVLSKEDLLRLLTDGRVTVATNHYDCNIARTTFNTVTNDFDYVKDSQCNYPMFNLTKDISDYKTDTYGIQFLSIEAENLGKRHERIW